MIRHGPGLRSLGFALSLLCVAAAPPGRSQDVAIGTIVHFKGSLLGFVEGDSQFAVFCVSGDSILTVGVSSPDAANFAAAHAGAMLDIEAEVIDIYEENGIVSPVYGMTDAAMGAYTAKKWSGEMVRALGYDRASKALLALEQSMILDREPARCRN